MKLLHLDEHIIVLDKPAGLPVLPDGWEKDAPYLVKMLEAEYGNPSTGSGQRIWIVHRLDKVTSGVIVFARNAEAHRSLNIQFEKRQVKKVYHALAEGNPKWDEHTARHHLRVDVGHKHRTIVDNRDGKPSATHFRVLERFAVGTLQATSLLEAIPETGRTHQVRVHAAELGHPLLADSVYGNVARNGPSTALRTSIPHSNSLAGYHPAPQISRPALHARSLTFTHPASGESVTFVADYPEDFAAALKRARSRTG